MKLTAAAAVASAVMAHVGEASWVTCSFCPFWAARPDSSLCTGGRGLIMMLPASISNPMSAGAAAICGLLGAAAHRREQAELRGVAAPRGCRCGLSSSVLAELKDAPSVLVEESRLNGRGERERARLLGAAGE